MPPAEIKRWCLSSVGLTDEPGRVSHTRFCTCRNPLSRTPLVRLDELHPNQSHPCNLSLAPRLFGYLVCDFSYASVQSAPTLQCKYLLYLVLCRAHVVNPGSTRGLPCAYFIFPRDQAFRPGDCLFISELIFSLILKVTWGLDWNRVCIFVYSFAARLNFVC